MYAILREVIDALFRIGGFNDAKATELHTAINEADPEFAAARQRAELELSDAEQAELARLQAKQQAAGQADVAGSHTATIGPAGQNTGAAGL